MKLNFFSESNTQKKDNKISHERRKMDGKLEEGIKSTLTFTTLPIDCDVENFFFATCRLDSQTTIIAHFFKRRGITRM